MCTACSMRAGQEPCTFPTQAQLGSLNPQHLLFSPKARQPISPLRICCCLSNASVPDAVSSLAADSGFALASAMGTEAHGVLEWVELQGRPYYYADSCLGLHYSYTLPAQNLTWDVFEATVSLQRQWDQTEATALSVRYVSPTWF